ncbi:hypothetical protein [Streptacidiphilus neutrinimicus]|uniref:hypothetical protein n=1 Tax=Streptacidiphilus neutrinimicus TaxID=105420 RepID=UPI0006943722|nr:hypothetical protein [Streptacidiphilus neutrinimicus]
MSTARHDPGFDAGRPYLHHVDDLDDRPARVPGRPLIRTIYHADPYAPFGVEVRCAQCGARRDWLFIEVGGFRFVRCRAAHDWYEPALTKEDFDSLFTAVERECEGGLEEIYRVTAFDGLLAGAYL